MTVQLPHYARLEMRPEIGIIEEPSKRHWMVPDVTVARAPRAARMQTDGGVAVLDEVRSELSKPIRVTVATAPLRHHFVEIRDPTRGHKLVTMIEIVSPSNKRPGIDRRVYEQKQKELLDSDANLIELDLLRTGERVISDPMLSDIVARLNPPAQYLVVVNRAWHRLGNGMGVDLFPFGVREMLPCIPVPLKQQEPAKGP